MKTIAKLQTDEAADLSERLKSEAIPNEMRAVAEEGGLDMTELLVEDSLYERACGVGDSWQTERLAEAETRCAWTCPNCKSRGWECVPNDKIEYLLRCKKCGSQFIICAQPHNKPPEPSAVGAAKSASRSTAQVGGGSLAGR